VKKFFAQLRPMERRLAGGVLVIFILVLNWLFIWPHFSDLGKLRQRIASAQAKLAAFQTAIAEKPKYEAMMKKFESAGVFVPPEDQAINFMQTVQMQAAASHVGIASQSHSTPRPGQFFTEQVQGINVVATDAQLVDFLYKLGSSASMVRVRDLELQPDNAHQHLIANIQLIASYQNKPVAAAPAAVIKSTPAPAPTTPSVTAAKTNSKPVKSK